MRKSLIIILFFLSASVDAQTKIGLRAGMNFSSILFKDYKPEKKMLNRVNLGTIIGIPLDENWSVYTGPYYSGKGVVHGRTGSTGRIDSFTIRLNYIELPINIAYKFNEGRPNRLGIAGGPYIAYGFNGEMRTINSSRPPTTHLHKKETDQYKRLELGFNFTTLFEINNRYGLRVDYSRSLTNIHRAEKELNSVVGVSVYWHFKTRQKTGD